MRLLHKKDVYLKEQKLWNIEHRVYQVWEAQCRVGQDDWSQPASGRRSASPIRPVQSAAGRALDPKPLQFGNSNLKKAWFYRSCNGYVLVVKLNWLLNFNLFTRALVSSSCTSDGIDFIEEDDCRSDLKFEFFKTTNGSKFGLLLLRAHSEFEFSKSLTRHIPTYIEDKFEKQVTEWLV